jgi:hypothetical protein
LQKNFTKQKASNFKPNTYSGQKFNFLAAFSQDMVNFTAYWNSASARLILIGVTLQISLVAIFSFMEAFSDADIASKTFGLYTEPRMIKKKPKKGEKKAKKDKKEKKDKKDKKDKESPKKKGKKGDGDQ